MISSIFLDGPSQTDEWVVVQDERDPVTQPPSRSPSLPQGSLPGTVTPPVAPPYGRPPSIYGAGRAVPPTPTSISSDGRCMSLGGEEEDEEEVILSGGYSPSFLPSHSHSHSLSHAFLQHHPFHTFTTLLPRKSMLGGLDHGTGSRVSPFPAPTPSSRSRSSSMGSETSTYYDAAAGGLSSPPSCVSLESGSMGVVSLCDEQDRDKGPSPSSYGSNYSHSSSSHSHMRAWTAEALQEQDSEAQGPTANNNKGYRTQDDEEEGEEEEDEDWEEASRRPNMEAEGEGLLWGQYSKPLVRGAGGSPCPLGAVARRGPERLVLEAGVPHSPPTWTYTPNQSASWLYSKVLGVVGSPPVQRAARTGVCCAGQCLHYVTSKLQTLLPQGDPPPVDHAYGHHSGEQDPDVRQLLRGPKPPKRSYYRQERGANKGQWTEEASGRPNPLPRKGKAIALELRPMHSGMPRREDRDRW